MRALVTGWWQVVSFVALAAVQPASADDEVVQLGPRAALREPAPDVAAGQSVVGALRTQLGPRTNTVDAVAFTPDGRWLASSGNDSAITLWDMRQGVPARRLSAHTLWAVSPNGRTLVSSGDGEEMWLWDLPRAAVRKKVRLPSDVKKTVFTADSKTLFTLSREVVSRWDAATGVRQAVSGKVVHMILEGGLAATPDGKAVVVGGKDGALVFLDGKTLEEKKRIRGHGRAIHALALSPDGKTLASVAFDDNLLKLWDVEKAAEIRTIKYEGFNRPHTVGVQAQALPQPQGVSPHEREVLPPA